MKGNAADAISLLRSRSGRSVNSATVLLEVQNRAIKRLKTGDHAAGGRKKTRKPLQRAHTYASSASLNTAAAAGSGEWAVFDEGQAFYNKQRQRKRGQKEGVQRADSEGVRSLHSDSDKENYEPLGEGSSSVAVAVPAPAQRRVRPVLGVSRSAGIPGRGNGKGRGRSALGLGVTNAVVEDAGRVSKGGEDEDEDEEVAAFMRGGGSGREEDEAVRGLLSLSQGLWK